MMQLSHIEGAPLPRIHELEAGLISAAQIVEKHGERFLPIYLLIEDVLEQAKKADGVMARVRLAAKRGGFG